MEQEKPTKPETDRTFPEDDDTLYREMTVHMPRCYFPTSLGENSILKFAGEEFRRVKNIVCRRYNFNEDKYIRENAGVSPFDSVRGNFEQEVYRRLRKDYAHLSIISIRRSLMEKIRDAVKKENNIIGTFYRNCGVHYREAESAEYETSPIVVVHNSAFYGYGGYESATVYELFIDGNGKLLCTLNGEAGEDFDEPIGQVQTEGLLEIAHWLEEHGFKIIIIYSMSGRTKVLLVCAVSVGASIFRLSAQEVGGDTITGKVHQIEKVTVTARRLPNKVASAVPIQTISRQDISQLGIQNMADAVRRFAGANVKDYGGIGGLKTVSIRNMGAAHTAVSYDGVAVSNCQAGQIDIGRFSLDNVSMLSLAIGQSEDLLQSARLYASAGVLGSCVKDSIYRKYRW